MITEPIALVIPALQDEDAQVRVHARNAMLNSKYRVTPKLTQALDKPLHHPNPDVRGIHSTVRYLHLHVESQVCWRHVGGCSGP